MEPELSYEEKMAAIQLLSGADKFNALKALKLEYSTENDAIRQTILQENQSN